MSKEWFKQHGPELAIIGGYIALFGAGIGACFATAKAVRRIDSIQATRADALTWKERFKIGFPYYIMPASVALAATTAFGFGTRGELVRAASLTKVVQMTAANLEAQKMAEKNVVGEKKAEQIEKEAIRKLGESEPLMLTDGIVDAGGGDTLFKDPFLLGGTVFRGDIQTIRARYNDIAETMIQGDNVVSAYNLVQEVYRIERPPECLHQLEWDISSNTHMPKIDIETDMDTDNGIIMHYIVHKNKPRLAFYY